MTNKDIGRKTYKQKIMTINQSNKQIKGLTDRKIQESLHYKITRVLIIKGII